MPHVTVKSNVSLTAAPKVDLAATTGFEGMTAGGEVSYDTAKSAITKVGGCLVGWLVGPDGEERAAELISGVVWLLSHC